ncbi:hypothetical protein CDB3_24880 [Bacillus sp. CDB3]|nr:hypothetical protein CDB3_24880 [Bacillus sp. CDB3]
MLGGIENFKVEKYEMQSLNWLSRKLLYEGKYEKINEHLFFLGLFVTMKFIDKFCVILMNFY